MYVKYDGMSYDGRVSLISRELSISSHSSSDLENEPRFMKLTNQGVKQVNHIICRVAADTEASKCSVRIFVDVKGNTTVDYLKDRIVDK